MLKSFSFPDLGPDSAILASSPRRHFSRTPFRHIGLLNALRTALIVILFTAPALTRNAYGSPALSAFYCSPSIIRGSAKIACTVKIASAAPSNGTDVSLLSNNAAVTLPAAVTIPVNTTSLQFPVSVMSVPNTQVAALTANSGGNSMTASLSLNAAVSTLTAGKTALSFGNVAANANATQTLILKSTGTQPLLLSSATATGAGFSVSGITFPTTLAPGQNATLIIQFAPLAVQAMTGLLTIASNDSSGNVLQVRLSGAGVSPLSAFYCNPYVIRGSGTIACTVHLNAAAPAAGLKISLLSNNAAVALPTVATVPANATSVQLSVPVTAVTSTQVATLTANAGGASSSLTLNLNAAASTLTPGVTALSFGKVAVNSPATQSLTLRSTGSEPLVLSSVTVTGSAFSVSGITFPATLAPGQTATLNVQFAPAALQAVNGQLTIASNDSRGTATLIQLSGSGVSPLSAFYCNPSVIKGSSTLGCTVKLSVSAPANGMTVSLLSSSAAVTLPAAVTVPANSSSFQFPVSVSSVIASQVTTLTASAGDGSISQSLSLNANFSALTLNTSELSFGNVAVKAFATQSLTLRSTGTEPLVLSSAAVSGSGFSVSGINFPATLAPGQIATLTVQFGPNAVQAMSGTLTVTSNDVSGNPGIVSLSGSGAAFTGSPLVSTVVSPTPSTPVTSDFFGMTIYNLASRTAGNTSNLTVFPPYQLATLRLWDVDYWANIEPTQGQFNWIKMDGTVAAGMQHGVNDFIFTFGQTPLWASSDPTDPCTSGEGPGTCSPPIMAAYEQFATQIVQHYCGKVKYYEPWNEPNNPPFWDGTNAQLLTMAQHLYSIAKDPANCGCTDGSCSPNGGVNPNQVLLPPIASSNPGSVEWLDSYLTTAGPNPYADIATFHGYVWWGYQPESIITVVDNIQQTLANHNLGNLQLWNTEASWGGDSAFKDNQQDQASWLMRSHITELAAGVSRYVWYAYDACDVGTLAVPLSPAAGCNNGQGAPDQLTLPGQAYQVIENWLIGANLTQCQEFQNGLWACELQRPGGYDAWVFWSTLGTTLPVAIPNSMQLTVYRDWQNKLNPLPAQLTVGQMPVLVENFDLPAAN
jgi:hypothetical protein